MKTQAAFLPSAFILGLSSHNGGCRSKTPVDILWAHSSACYMPRFSFCLLRSDQNGPECPQDLGDSVMNWPKPSGSLLHVFQRHFLSESSLGVWDMLAPRVSIRNKFSMPMIEAQSSKQTSQACYDRHGFES